MKYPSLVSDILRSGLSFEVLAWASARINLLGEHIDYNQGYVMPASIQFKTITCLKNNGKNEYYFFSDHHPTVHLSGIKKQSHEKAWVNYLLGVMDKFSQAGVSIPYFDCTIISTVPVGAGLSSSAALSCSFALALQNFLRLNLSLEELAKIAQWSEHEYAGVKCGLIDQTASLQGKQSQILIMDCLTNKVEYIPIQLSKEKFILLDSGVKHMLDNSAYNKRRQSCEEGFNSIRSHFPNVHSFRDVSLNMLDVIQNEEIKKRCQFVIQEIERTQLAVSVIKSNNVKALGSLMYATHHGLSGLYEVSCEETDYIVDELNKLPTAAGARMMGAGFGGCVLALVKADDFEHSLHVLEKKYRDKFALKLKHYEVTIDDASGCILPSIA
ncbi:MAG: galactokinase [Cyclobacteriaceae bacterium]|jgi:galactokinase|nr:galactokinase [Cytophagales bacterium]MCZ8326608.1 galactokinase [Cyclobacteriaceae bacterium]